MNLPNLLTTIRFLLIPLFVYVFFHQGESNILYATYIFILAGITDVLDGYVARKYDLITKWGQAMDPLADKLSMIAVFISLAIVKILPLWIIVIILAREITILIGSLFVYFTGHDIIFPNRFGKLATFCLYSTAAASILSVSFFDKLFLSFAIPLTLLSAIDYIIKAYRHYFQDVS